MFKPSSCSERQLKFAAHAVLYSFVSIPIGLLLWYYITESNTIFEIADRAIDEFESVKSTIVDDQIRRNYRKIFVKTTYRISVEDRTLTYNIDQSNRTVMEEISKLANDSNPNSLQCFTKTSSYNRKYFEMVIKLKECCVSDRLKLLENGLREILWKAIREVDEIFNGLKREYDICRELNLRDCLNNVIKTIDGAKSEFVEISNRFSNEIYNFSQTINLDDVGFINANLQELADNLRGFMEICTNSE